MARIGSRLGPVLALIAALVTACGGQPAAAPTPAKAAAPASASAPAAKKVPIRIRVAYPGEPETKDLPSVLAWRSLPADQYKFEIIPAAGVSKSTQAVITSEADVASGSYVLAMNGILKGANVRIISENVGLHWRLIAHKDIKKIEDLQGKMVAQGVAGAQDAILLDETKKKYKIDPPVIRSGQSADRVQALVNGQVVAMVGTPEDFAFAEEKKPGQFQILTTYAKELPKLGGTFFWVNGDFLNKYPEALTDMVEAQLKMYRRVLEDRAFLLSEFKKAFPEQSEAKLNKTIDYSYESQMWNSNGRVDTDTLNYTLRLNVDYQAIPEMIPLDKWVAPQFAEAALKKLGKK